jgi:hypothetical protein
MTPAHLSSTNVVARSDEKVRFFWRHNKNFTHSIDVDHLNAPEYMEISFERRLMTFLCADPRLKSRFVDIMDELLDISFCTELDQIEWNEKGQLGKTAIFNYPGWKWYKYFDTLPWYLGGGKNNSSFAALNLFQHLLNDVFNKSEKSIFHNRRVARLDDSRYALLLASARKGDLVCYLVGSKTPFLLRRHASIEDKLKEEIDLSIRNEFSSSVESGAGRFEDLKSYLRSDCSFCRFASVSGFPRII